MKKILTICLASGLILSGCGKKTTDTHEPAVFIKKNADYYQNGVVIGNNIAMFLDFETLNIVPLCAVPNCTHLDSKCLAQNVGNKPIFYNNYIYYFESNGGNVRETSEGREFFIDSKLKKASLDSSEIEVVCEFNDCVPPDGYNGFVLQNGDLYFIGDDCNPVKDDYGGINWGNTGGYHYLCSINLDTGKYTNHGSIYDGDKEYEAAPYSSQGFISGVFNDKMFISYSFMKDLKELEDPESNFTVVNFEFDFSTKQWTKSTLPYSEFMTGNIYTYYDFESKKLIVIDNENKTEILFEYEPINFRIFNNKFFYPLKQKWYDLSDLSEHTMGEYADYEAVGYYNNCYILVKGNNAVKLTEEELLALE